MKQSGRCQERTMERVRRLRRERKERMGVELWRSWLYMVIVWKKL